MNSQEVPPFVGTLWGDDCKLGTAFGCHDTRLLITCEHNLRSNPTKLKWERFSGGENILLEKYTILIRDADRDIAIIASDKPLHPRSALARQPLDPASHGLDVYFHGLGQFDEEGVSHWVRDLGYGRIIGSNAEKGDRRRFKLESQHVTKGFSGAPVLHYCGIGVIVVGMITSRYSSTGNQNRDTAWVVPATFLAHAIQIAGRMLEETQAGKDSLVELDVPFDAIKLRELLALQRSSTEDDSSDISMTSYNVLSPSGLQISRLSDFER
ncbi:trypsin-like peptidase domain-containing protein [Amycolatopsis sp. H6(2020)]|nr:trypsin-like peptidase domain-containing protein [Amycolatopsis sp. H6(2020)]